MIFEKTFNYKITFKNGWILLRDTDEDFDSLEEIKDYLLDKIQAYKAVKKEDGVEFMFYIPNPDMSDGALYVTVASIVISGNPRQKDDLFGTIQVDGAFARRLFEEVLQEIE